MPRHRAGDSASAPARNLRRAALRSGVAVAATGIAVASGIALDLPHVDTASASQAIAASAQKGVPAMRPPADVARRTAEASRSGERAPLEVAKKATLSQVSGGQQTHTEDLGGGDPRAIARALLPRFGYSESQFSCLDSLYMSESGWNVHATNSFSGAYGIPQALPASKMAAAGPDWRDDAATQIKWGLEYIKLSYGSPCGAWEFKASHNWY